MPTYQPGYANTVLADVLNTVLPELPSIFEETLGKSASSYVWADMFMRSMKSVGGTGALHEFRTKRGTGITTHKAYGDTPAPSVENLLARYIVPIRHLKWGYAFDDIEQSFTGDKEAVYDAVKARISAEMEAKFEDMESIVMGVPANSSDNEGVHGIPFHIRPGIDSGGAVVATATPAANGRYLKAWGDGTTVGRERYFDIADRGDPSVQRLNNFTALYPGTIDESAQNTMRLMRRALNWKRLEGLQGNTNGLTGDFPYALVLPESIGVSIEALAQDWVEETGGDVAGVTGDRVRWQNIRFIESKFLDGVPGLPMYLLNTSKIKAMHHRRFKEKQYDVRSPEQVTTRRLTTVISYNIDCDVPQYTGAVIHTSAI
jgi:hypothetical protein